MNINELFNFVDSVKPNAFDDETKMVWLNELEAMIQMEVYLKAEPELYKNADEELHLMPPYDSVYRYYLQAMIDFHNGEYDKYNATYEMFNEKYGEKLGAFDKILGAAEGNPEFSMARTAFDEYEKIPEPRPESDVYVDGLIETVEETGLIYAYGENYCYMPGPYEMRKLYKEGKIGEFEYGEGEYIHNCESIWPSISYGDPNHWRNLMHANFYCTHSIGPLIHITGLRPVKVVGLEGLKNKRNLNTRKEIQKALSICHCLHKSPTHHRLKNH